jgi:hypothetical protein
MDLMPISFDLIESAALGGGAGDHSTSVTVQRKGPADQRENPAGIMYIEKPTMLLRPGC